MLNATNYVNLSGQIAIDRRMATIANNIANAGTAGYRAEELKFDTVLSTASRTPTAFSTSGDSFISLKSGGFNKTGNPLDVAVAGEGFLAIQTPGGTAYTRDGRLQISAAGDVLTVTGHAVVDAGGAPLQLDPNGGPPRIARDGMITQNGRQVGAIGLYALDFQQGYSRTETSAVIPVAQAVPIVSFASDGVVQGFIEEANVNPVTEMTSLIAVTRNFDALQTALDESDNALKKAIQALGGG